jgi:predicted RNase H-like nuclease (RuvC/YqgF family)
MNSNIELPSGKILALDHFVALLPTEDTDECQYSLILEGYSQAIYLNQTEADIVKQKLQLTSNNHQNGNWDQEEQIRKNQPKLKLLRERIEKLKQEVPSPEKEAEFEAFKKIIDAERPAGQKLYEDLD